MLMRLIAFLCLAIVGVVSLQGASLSQLEQQFKQRHAGKDCTYKTGTARQDCLHRARHQRSFSARKRKQLVARRNGLLQSRNKLKVKWGRRAFRNIKRGVMRVARHASSAVRTVSRVSSTVANGAVSSATHAANQVAKKTVSATKGVGAAVVNAAKETASFAEETAKDVEDIANDVAAHVEKYAKILEDFFKMFSCMVNPKEILQIAKELTNLNSNTLNILKDPNNYKNIASGARTIAAATCTTVWTGLLVSSPWLTALKAFLQTMKNQCGALNKINPAVSIGVAVGAGVQAGYSLETSAELGLAMDLAGNQYCYIGGCVAKGMTLPPIPSAEADTGVAVSIWKDISAIPGDSKALSVNANFAIGKLGVEMGLTYIYSTSGITDFLGISAAGEVGVAAEVEVSVGVSTAACSTPVCLSIKGCNCGETCNGPADQGESSGSPCAEEGEYCTCKGTVWYGTGDKWGSRTTNGAQTFHCSNHVFGDPAPYQRKSCKCVGNEDNLGNECADHGGYCHCTGAVSYGSNGYFNQKVVVNGIHCDHHNFGDPVFGLHKRCYCNPMGHHCANEGGTCSCLGAVTYGANNKYVSKLIYSGSTPCTNAVFGDPVFGTGKACYCNSDPDP